jgi:hypothetical protein
MEYHVVGVGAHRGEEPMTTQPVITICFIESTSDWKFFTLVVFFIVNNISFYK